MYISIYIAARSDANTLAYMVSPSSGHHCACLWAGTYMYGTD